MSKVIDRQARALGAAFLAEPGVEGDLVHAYETFAASLSGPLLVAFKGYLADQAPKLACLLKLEDSPKKAEPRAQLTDLFLKTIDRRVTIAGYALTAEGVRRLRELASRSNDIGHNFFLISSGGIESGLEVLGLSMDEITTALEPSAHFAERVAIGAARREGVSFSAAGKEQIGRAFMKLSGTARTDLMRKLDRNYVAWAALEDVGLELELVPHTKMTLIERTQRRLDQDRLPHQVSFDAAAILSRLEGLTPYSRHRAAFMLAGMGSIIRTEDRIVHYLEPNGSRESETFNRIGDDVWKTFASRFDFESASLSKAAGYHADVASPTDVHLRDAMGRGFRLTTTVFDSLGSADGAPHDHRAVFVEYGAMSAELEKCHGHVRLNHNTLTAMLEPDELTKMLAVVERLRTGLSADSPMLPFVTRFIEQASKTLATISRLV